MSTETGDRNAFLTRVRSRLVTAAPPNPAHPLPGPLDAVPVVRSTLLDEADLLGSFVRNARAVRAEVHEVDGAEVPAALVAAVVERHGVHRAVASREPEVGPVASALTALGVRVDPVGLAASAGADLGVTGAVAGLATTGTVVQHSGAAGGRTASLLPPVHLCVLAASRIVASTAEVLRGLGRQARPSNLVLVTGPSRSGDIEQIITLGVHGPLAVEIVLLRGA